MINCKTVLLVILVVFAQLAFPAGTDDISAQLIEDIQYRINKDGEAVIEVRFSVPMRLVQSRVRDRSSRAEAHFQFHLNELQKKRLPLEEVRVAERNPDIPLRSITYDGFNLTDPLVSIQFNRMVAYQIEQLGNDSIKIVLPEVKPASDPINLVSGEEARRLAEMRRAQQAKTPSLKGAQAPVTGKPSQPSSSSRTGKSTEPKKKTQIAATTSRTPPKTKAPARKPQKKAIPLPPKTRTGGKGVNEKAMGTLMAQARAALTRQDNAAAIKLFTKVLNTAGHSYHPEAQELLALARQRNGQTEHAKRLYAHYLKLYPDGAGHVRVKQRLAELETPAVVPAGTLKKSRTLAANGFRKDVYGSFSMYNFAGQQNTTQNDTTTGTKFNTLQTYMNFNGRFRNPRFDIRTVAYGTVTRSEDDDETETEFEANRMYLEFKDSRIKYDMRLGRQSGNTSGIFGRFDGFQMGYQMASKFRINGAYGYSVDFNEKDRIKTNMPFVSGSVGFGTFFKHLDVSPYFFNQQIDGVVNRSSAGLEARWSHPKFNLFGLVDYETQYQETNLMMFNAMWRLTNATSVSLNYDDRTSPLLETRNFLTINSVSEDTTCRGDTIEEALSREGCTEDRLRQLALEKTGTSQYVTLAVNHSFSQTFQLNADISLIDMTLVDLVEEEDPTRFEDEFEKTVDRLQQQVVSGQIILSSLFQGRDSNIFGVRYTDDTSYGAMQLSLSNRFAFGRSLRLRTRLLTEQRQYVEEGEPGSENITRTDLFGAMLTRLQPSLKLDYRWKRSFEIQAEVSYNQVDYDNEALADSDYTIYTLGFRQQF